MGTYADIQHHLRSVVLSKDRSTLSDRAFSVAVARAWNTLPFMLRTAPSLTTFWRHLKTELFNTLFSHHHTCFDFNFVPCPCNSFAVSRHFKHVLFEIIITRKLSYRKDDRAMRPIIRVPWKFSRAPEYAHSYFSWLFNGHLFRSITRICVQNFKFVALPVPEIIWGT